MKKIPKGCFLEHMVIASHKRLLELREKGDYSLNTCVLEETPPINNFDKIFNGNGIVFIGEVKPASPTEGDFGSFDFCERVNEYVANGVRALSILTEPARFGGKNENVLKARVAGVPVLRKDFLIAPEQVVESRIIGADAVLLMASILTADELVSMLEVTHSLGMKAIVEVHDRGELDEAVQAGAGIIGINNRNIRTLEIDLNCSFELLPLVPGGIIAISESGVSEREQVVALKKAGAKGILIGSALMRTGKPGEKIRELSGE